MTQHSQPCKQKTALENHTVCKMLLYAHPQCTNMLSCKCITILGSSVAIEYFPHMIKPEFIFRGFCIVFNQAHRQNFKTQPIYRFVCSTHLKAFARLLYIFCLKLHTVTPAVRWHTIHFAPLMLCLEGKQTAVLPNPLQVRATKKTEQLHLNAERCIGFM